MTEKLALNEFLRLVPTNREFRTALPRFRIALRKEYKKVYDRGVPWSTISPILMAEPGFPWTARQWDAALKNFRKKTPTMGPEKCFAFLYWLYRDHGTDPLAAELSAAASRMWAGVSSLSPSDALKALPLTKIEGGNASASRWLLRCISNRTSDPTLLAFTLDDLGQRSTLLGDVNAFLQVYSDTREIREGVIAGFSSLTITTTINTDSIGDVSLSDDPAQPSASDLAITLLRKGVRLGEFWEVSHQDGGMLRGEISFLDAPIFSIRPRQGEVQFDVELSVSTRGLKTEGAASHSTENKNAILTSLLCSGIADGPRRRGTFIASRRTYRIDMD